MVHRLVRHTLLFIGCAGAIAGVAIGGDMMDVLFLFHISSDDRVFPVLSRYSL